MGFKLLTGSKCGTNLLPQKGLPARSVISYPQCLTPEECEYVYKQVYDKKEVKPVQTSQNPYPKVGYDKQADQLVEGLHIQEFLKGCESSQSDSSEGKDFKTDCWSILSTEPSYYIPDVPGKVVCRISKGTEAHKLEQFQVLSEVMSEPESPPPSEGYDHFEGVIPVVQTDRYYQFNTDVCVTYLGHQQHGRKSTLGKESFAIDAGCHCTGQLLTGEPIQVLIDTGASKCFLSKRFYDAHPAMHGGHKIPIPGASVKVGDGRAIPILFAAPIVLQIDGHVFEVFCLVTDIGTNELVIGMKALVELEASVNISEFRVDFQSRSLALYPSQSSRIDHGQTSTVRVNVPFPHELSGFGIVKVMLNNILHTLYARFCRNELYIDIGNTLGYPLYLDPQVSIGVLDARSMGYFQMSHRTLQQQLMPKYTFRYLHEMDQEETLFENLNGFRIKRGHSNKKQTPEDPYPWLDDNDPRRSMTDEEILHQTIDLEPSCLSEPEKEVLMNMILKHKEAFSLRDEIGECPNLKIDIEVIDKSPFFVRPFRISEEDKPIMDKQMKRLVSLGILTKNTTSHTSPVMLISRKVTKDKRPIVDFRLLNTRILRRNNATPLMKDIRSILGNSNCEVFSCLDLKDAYHSIRLTEKAKEYCGILPYFGSPHYRYEVLPMGLNISPAKWMEYVEVLLEKVENRHNYIIIMDDLLLHSTIAQHFTLLEDLFQSIIRCGLKLSPKKCQLFRTKLLYMGNIFEVTSDGVTMSVVKTRQEAIEQMPPPRTAKQCKMFCGVANYLSEFCPNLQKELRPIYDLTRKGRPFIWTEMHQEAFEAVKQKLTSAPVLTCPISGGRFTLFTDTSRQHVGSCLWQRQNGKNRLIGYASKTLPGPCQNYGVTELEMYGMVVSMKMWSLWLGRNEFDCVVDHQAIVHIVKSKDPPATERIKKFLEELGNFNALYYYLKGKHMIISDFLSRMSHHENPSFDIVPVGFTPKEVLHDHLNTPEVLDSLYQYTPPVICDDQVIRDEQVVIRDDRVICGVIRDDRVIRGVICGDTAVIRGAQPPEETLCITTRSQKVKMPEVHGATKGIDPNLKPEHQHKSKDPHVLQPQLQPQGLGHKPSQAQRLSRKLVKRSVKTLTQPRNAPSKPNLPLPPEEHELPNELAVDPGLEDIPHTPRPMATSTPIRSYSKPRVNKQSHQAPSVGDMPIQLEGEIKPTGLEADVETPFDEVETVFRKPVSKDFEIPPSLAEQASEDRIVHKFLPKQVDLETVLKQVQNKVLRKTHFPTSMKDMEAAYLHSPFFRDIFVYLSQNKVPVDRKRLARIQVQAYNYFLLDSLLFKLEPDATGDMVAKLCIPTSKVDMLLEHYHTSVLGGHQGMTKTLLTLKQHFFCPRLADHVQAYILGCHVCQVYKKGKKFDRPYLKRIHLGAKSFSRVSMDIKYMPASGPYKYMLVIICEVTNFINCMPLRTTQATEVSNQLLQGHIKHYGPPQYLICDKDPGFLAGVTQGLLKMLGIKLITVGPTNHQSLSAEHAIKSISTILAKGLADKGSRWHEYLAPAQLAHNSAVSPNLDGLSPYHLAFGHSAITNPIARYDPDTPLQTSHKAFYAQLVKRIGFLHKKIQDHKDSRVEMQNKDKEHHHYQTGDLVYLYQPKGALIQSGSKKVACNFVGPLVIYKAISPRQFFLMSLDGLLYPHLIEETRIKPGKIYTSMGLVTNLADLRRVLRAGLAIKAN